VDRRGREVAVTARDAIERLRADPGDAAAWRVVDELLAALARKETDDPALRDAAVAAVRRKLEDKLLDDDLDPIASPPSYFGNAIRWKVRDALRGRRREERAVEKARAMPPPPAEVPEVLPADVLGTLERVAERAIARRDEWQRDHLRRAWRQIRALHLEDLTLRQIVVADEGINPADEPAIQLAVQRAHKAHQRARAAFAEALEQLVAQGKVDPETADAARTAITRLKRRQDRAAPRVSGTKEGES
jgi:hypothetical protein